MNNYGGTLRVHCRGRCPHRPECTPSGELHPFERALFGKMEEIDAEGTNFTSRCTKVQREVKFVRNKKANKIKICANKFSP